MLVNGFSEVMKYQCRQSNGGLYYGNYDEFELALTRILDDPQLAAQMGRQGRKFVQERFNWDVILAKFQALFEALIGH